MRKVLLATTALVALGGVSAASADVTVSGKTMFNATSWSDNITNTGNNNDTDMETSFELDITASATTDNGLTWSTNIDVHDDTENLSVSGDFGKLYFSNSKDGDGDAFATSADPVADEDYGGTTITFNGNESVDGGVVSYKSNAINGFSFAIGYTDGDSNSSTASKADGSSYGVSYSTTAAGASVTVQYAASDLNTAAGIDGVNSTSLGLKVSSGDLGLTLAQNTKETKSGSTVSSDYKGDGLAITYKLNDQMSLALQTVSVDDGKSTYEFEANAASLSYTIGAGAVAHLSVTDYDQKGGSATVVSGTSTELEVAFSF